MQFLVRVSYKTDFSYRRWELGYSVAKTMVEILGDYIIEDVCSDCLTFVTFIVEDINAKTCEERIRKAWELQWPGEENALNVMMVEYDDSEVSQVMRAVYTVYYGWDEYQKLCTEFVRSVPLVKDKNAFGVFREMSYLIAIDEGCGFQTMTSSFADLLYKLNVFEIDEVSQVDNEEEEDAKTQGEYYNYIVGEKDGNGRIASDSLVDMLWKKENTDIVIGIDITYFLGGDKNEELRKFLWNLQKVKNDYIFLFRIPVLSKTAFEDFCRIIDDILEIRTISIEPYDDFTLMEYCMDKLCVDGYSPSRDLFEVFLQRVHKEKMDGRFYGYETANKIVNELIWAKAKKDADAKYCGEEYDLENITKSDVIALSVEEEKKKSGFEELTELVGMEDIAKRMEEIVSQVLFAMKNDSMDRPCLHMRFVGAPGTGKTTVARIVGKIFKEKEILRKGDFFEYEARNLCGEYIGQTAPKTRSVCKDAYGSVLFIDEAYSLYTGENDRDYGQEAITTLIAEMENHRDDMVVIMAGYTDDMEKLMESNSGLRSRMPYVIEFKSYTKQQLAAIFMKMASKNFNCEEGLEERVNQFFLELEDSYINSKEFANARFVRNLYERSWSKAAIRMASTNESKMVLMKSDFEMAIQEKEFQEKLVHSKKIGF